MGVEKLNWADARILMHKANPEFVALLDTVDGIDKYEFTKYSYRYGDLVGDANYFYDPDGNIVSDNIPFGMVVEKSMQFFMELGEYIIPGQLQHVGEFAYMTKFSFAKTINLTTTWCICAGTRVPVLVSSYRQYNKYQRMQNEIKSDISIIESGNMENDFAVLRNVARAVNSDWRFEYIGFSDKLSDFLKNSESTWRIREYILSKLMKSNQASNTKNLHHEIILNYIKVHHSAIKNFYYLSNVINHVFDAISGHSVIHKLATNDSNLPLQAIQEAYCSFYKPKTLPLILTSSTFIDDPYIPHYFSIPYHTMMYRPEHIANIIELCANVKELVRVYADKLLETPAIKGGLLTTILPHIDLNIIGDRFNSYQKSHDAILVSELGEFSEDFRQQSIEINKGGDFYSMPQRSNFFSGSIQLVKSKIL
ncbi:hypothetical protein [Cysteiniphilum litorale]|uniref:hypothetical protein n=1 Tax=Cysteiniphilum litorale TaxID=2056700 RepID=UPI003F883851